VSQADALFAQPQTLPGWFGKLPGMGDFAHRRLPEPVRAQWDQWLQAGLLQLRRRHEDDWTERYLAGPLWCFVLAEDVAGPRPWLGVLMPSVDGVGRYFPFMLAIELAGPLADGPAQARGRMCDWWQRAAAAALEGLEQDLDAQRFDALLAGRFGALGAAEEEEEAQAASEAPALPEPGHSLWLTEPDGAGGLRMPCAGLPQGERFEALFGFADEASLHEGRDT